jgi:hypothetical protein
MSQPQPYRIVWEGVDHRIGGLERIIGCNDIEAMGIEDAKQWVRENKHRYASDYIDLNRIRIEVVNKEAVNGQLPPSDLVASYDPARIRWEDTKQDTIDGLKLELVELRRELDLSQQLAGQAGELAEEIEQAWDALGHRNKGHLSLAEAIMALQSEIETIGAEVTERNAE